MRKILFIFSCLFLLTAIDPAVAQLGKKRQTENDTPLANQFEELGVGLLLTEKERDLVYDYMNIESTKASNTDANIDLEEKKKKEEQQRALIVALELYNKGDFDQALKEFLPLAQKDVKEAQELAGVMYRLGRGTDKNINMAKTFLEKAAAQNMPLALHHLGDMYYRGEGVEKNFIRALMYLNLAISAYNNSGGMNQAVRDHDTIASNLSRLEREKAKQMANSWKTNYNLRLQREEKKKRAKQQP